MKKRGRSGSGRELDPTSFAFRAAASFSPSYKLNQILESHMCREVVAGYDRSTVATRHVTN